MIQIILDDETKKRIVQTHWLWFWFRLNNTHINLSTGQQTLFQFFNSQLQWTKTDFKNLVLGNYRQLLKFTRLSDKYYNDFTSASTRTFTKRTKTYSLADIIQESMGYKDFRRGKTFLYKCHDRKRMEEINNWGAYALVKELKLKVCPYCNKNPILTFDSDKVYKGEIDHFFPEAAYPYLSCSLFNFIPSCHTCNKDKDSRYNIRDKVTNKISLTIYPYYEGFEQEVGGCMDKNARFKLVPGQNSIFESKSVELEYKRVSLKEKMTNSNDAFYIEKNYNACQMELDALIGRYKKNTQPKKDNILQIISSGLMEQIKTAKIPIKFIQNVKNQILNRNKEKIRLKILDIPVDRNGDYVKGEYPFRKFKNDIIDHIDEWIEKKKNGTI